MYIAKKPCHFGGKQRFIGDEIPSECIAPGNEARLVSMGLIELVPDKEPEPPLSPDAAPGQENPQATTEGAVDGVNSRITPSKRRKKRKQPLLPASAAETGAISELHI